MAVAKCAEMIPSVLPVVGAVVKKCAACLTALTPTGTVFVVCGGIAAVTCILCATIFKHYDHKLDMEIQRIKSEESRHESDRKTLETHLTHQRLQYNMDLEDKTKRHKIDLDNDLTKLRTTLHDEREKIKMTQDNERETLKTTLEDARLREKYNKNHEIRLKELELEEKKIQLEHDRKMHQINLENRRRYEFAEKFGLQSRETAFAIFQQPENDPTELLMPALEQLVVRNN